MRSLTLFLALFATPLAADSNPMLRLAEQAAIGTPREVIIHDLEVISEAVGSWLGAPDDFDSASYILNFTRVAQFDPGLQPEEIREGIGFEPADIKGAMTWVVEGQGQRRVLWVPDALQGTQQALIIRRFQVFPSPTGAIYARSSEFLSENQLTDGDLLFPPQSPSAYGIRGDFLLTGGSLEGLEWMSSGAPTAADNPELTAVLEAAYGTGFGRPTKVHLYLVRPLRQETISQFALEQFVLDQFDSDSGDGAQPDFSDVETIEKFIAVLPTLPPFQTWGVAEWWDGTNHAGGLLISFPDRATAEDAAATMTALLDLPGLVQGGTLDRYLDGRGQITIVETEQRFVLILSMDNLEPGTPDHNVRGSEGFFRILSLVYDRSIGIVIGG